MIKTLRRGEAKSFNPWFVFLQMVGGAPEGAAGAIIGFLSKNYSVAAVGCWAMLYNAFMLSVRLFK